MSRISLLPEGNAYKANLHCHSTLSDGRLTPAELKDAYKAQGYSVLCITDHELLIDHSDLNDPDFLMLTGYEISINDDPAKVGGDWSRLKVCHINLFSPRPDYTKYVCYHPDCYNDHMRESLRMEDVPEESYTRVYSPACISDIVRIAHEAGFLAAYNHPTWSLETAAEYTRYKGFDMMEIVNAGCYLDGLDETNNHAYDEMLRAGRRLAASATDDNHNAHAFDTGLTDSFGGWVWIKAPSLAYDAIWEALRYGDFYASTGGPEISVLEAEGDTVRIVCSGARQIQMSTAGRTAACRRPRPGAPLLTEETFQLTGSEGYIRFELTGPDGCRTFTRAYFLDEFMK